ncbi:MAG: symmetrical bis(5'-nucleosyl)-tetraphosphatase [Legionellaceae bacterium]|nr:symmetrical bis(5'-nucleosyl)-tetraphosphatase [Legionellaceae bacterium]
MTISNGYDYAIGDVQGCFDTLQHLLDKIHFNEFKDRLWFVGDLVNRGPQSLEVLHFIKNLPIEPRIALGNHDLHLLNLIFTDKAPDQGDTLTAILTAPDCEALGHWLRKQAILCWDSKLQVVMSHAGIAPMWDLAQAKKLASELEHALRSDGFRDFLTQMYGNTPIQWSESLTGISRLRAICNYFTRMRFCHADGSLALEYKEDILNAPMGIYPWYAISNRVEIDEDIVFGHWAALEGQCPHPRIHAIDTGCVWGKTMTALRLQDMQRVTVSAL